MALALSVEERPTCWTACPWSRYCVDYLSTCEGVCKVTQLTSNILKIVPLPQKISTIPQDLNIVTGFFTLPDFIKNLLLFGDSLRKEKSSQVALSALNLLHSTCGSLLFLNNRIFFSLQNRVSSIRSISLGCGLFESLRGLREGITTYDRQEKAIAKESSSECIEHYKRLRGLACIGILSTVLEIALAAMECISLLFGCAPLFPSLALSLSTTLVLLGMGDYFGDRAVKDMTPSALGSTSAGNQSLASANPI